MSDVLVNDDANEAPAAVAVRPLLRYAATAMAVTRVAIGVTALAWPSLPARAWVGPSDPLSAEILGRALGARDLALGLGALAALSKGPSGARAASAWCAAGALSDALDCATTAAAWPRLPRVTRWLVAGSSGGAALAGAAGAIAILPD